MGSRLTRRAAVPLLALATALSSCSAPSPKPAVRREVAPGARLKDPPELVSHNGLLRARLVVQRRKVDVAGRKRWALTYNDRYMPPHAAVPPG
ncbi:hypothetical protein [Streptomyces malaysiensis]|uniref:hypothetical protein n=1 Tax=Streptomyces malaysiensis TaxID=92644 RepID=UPI0036789A5F